MTKNSHYSSETSDLYFLDRIKIEPLRSKQSTAGKRIAFTCNAIEGNHVRFSWTKNGKVIYPGARISIMSGDEMSALTIKSVNTNDSGEYTCIASNDASEDRSSAKLIVEGNSLYRKSCIKMGLVKRHRYNKN